MAKSVIEKQPKMIWEEYHTLDINQKIDSISFSPDGKLLACGENVTEYPSKPTSIHIWNVESNTKIKTLTLDVNSSRIRAVTFSPDGKCVLGCTFGSAYILDVTSGNVKQKLILERDGTIKCATYSPDGNYVVSGSTHGKGHIWDVKSGTTIRTLEVGYRTDLHSVAYSPDGKYVVSGYGEYVSTGHEYRDNTVRIWDVESGIAIKTLNGHTKEVSSVAYSPDGKYVVSGSSDGAVRIWDIVSGKEKHKLDGKSGVNTVAYSPDGKYVVAGSGNKINIWNTKTGKVQQMMKESTSSIAFSQDGIYIASTCISGTWENCVHPFKIRLWKMKNSNILRKYLRDTEGWNGMKEQDTRLMSPEEQEEFLKWHPDNIMSNLSDSVRERWALDVPKESKSADVLGNVTPFIDRTCKRIGKLYQKYEHDVEKLKIVHGKVNELFKDIRSDKRLNMHTRKSLSKRSVRSLSMPNSTTKKLKHGANSF